MNYSPSCRFPLGTPGLLIPLARQAWLSEAPNLRSITNSGGKLPVASIRALRSARPQTKIFLMYGLTEAFRASFLPPDEVDDHPNSIGRAFEGSHLELVDATGRLLPAQEVGEGELLQGGPLVTAGYFNDAESTACRFRAPPAGWPYPEDDRVVYSGDRVRRDAQGRLYFLGRMDEQIKSQGMRVSPEEVESVALQFEGVIEALAFGYQTDNEETRIGLVVAPQTIDTEALDRWLKTRLAPFQMPAASVAVHALPRSNNSKLDRQASRTLFLDRLAASSSTKRASSPNSGTLAP
ncbi:MAG: AMP-binding protein [Halothiobacillus sp.]|nr:AMP-binding protein [Halothiobacillus sp.]